MESGCLSVRYRTTLAKCGVLVERHQVETQVQAYPFPAFWHSIDGIVSHPIDLNMIGISDQGSFGHVIEMCRGSKLVSCLMEEGQRIGCRQREVGGVLMQEHAYPIRYRSAPKQGRWADLDLSRDMIRYT